MSISLINLFIFYWVSVFSCLGYGIMFLRILSKKDTIYNYGYIGLFGVFFLIIYSYISHFFYSHSLIHNSIIIFVGFLFFIYSFFFLEFFNKKKVKRLLIIFLLIFICFVIYKPHDDFAYYHFQYTYYLTKFPLIIGIGQFNHGFKTPSSIFYLNSLFYLPFIKFSLFHISALLVFGYSNVILIEKLFRYLKNNKPNYISYYLLLSFTFINIIFYRLAEHGTDRSAQVLVFILVLEIILLVNDREKINNSLIKIFLLLSLIISFKAFYILYLIFLAPIIIYGYSKHNLKLFFIIFKNKLFYLFAFVVIIILLTNFFNSGCFLYPVSLTCIETMPWAYSSEHVNHMNNWYEQWSKAGAGPNFRVENPQEYILYFNWVSNWLNEYFFNKVSDFLLGLFSIIFVSYMFFYSNFKKSFDHRNKDKIISIYICLIILFCEWFYNHPSLRYGGYVLIAILVFLPVSINLEKNSKRFTVKKFKILISITFFIFILRNLDRLNDEIQKYTFAPLKNSHYRINNDYFKIDKDIQNTLDVYEECKTINSCKDNLVGKFFGKKFIINLN